MKSDDLPFVEDLKKAKIEVINKINPQGDQETEMRGWPEYYPGDDFTTGKNLWYLFVKWLIGSPRKARKKVKGYGWALLTGLGLFVAIIVGAAIAPIYAFDLIGTFVGTFIVFFLIFYYGLYKDHYFGAYRRLEKGERYPVAYERDDTGKLRFLWETAQESVTDILRIPYECLDFIWSYGVTDEPSSNHGITWNLKGWYHNFFWGPLLYADLDTVQFSVLNEQYVMYPENLDRALEKMKKFVRKDDLTEAESKYLEEKAREMYAASELIHDDEKEILERYGKRIIKVKLTKSTYAFFKAWQPIMMDMEAQKLNWIKRNKLMKPELIMENNKARETTLEARSLNSEIKRSWEEGRKWGFTEAEKTYAVALGKPSDLMEAEKAPIAHDANAFLNDTLEKKWKEKLEKGVLGIGDEEDNPSE